jgi:solute carrier family 50 protein (sugar transporter)
MVDSSAFGMMISKPQGTAFVKFCGKAAPIVCSAVFVAPLPTISKVVSTRTVGGLPLLPYSSMAVNAFIWMVYGLLNAETKVWQPNLFGLIMASYYCFQYKKVVPRNASNLPGTLSQHFRYGTLLMTFTILLASTLENQVATAIIGKLGVIICIVLFASPLSTLKTVIATKSAKSIPLPFTLGCMLNCFLWTVTGIFEMKDFNIIFPNVLGLLSAIAQFALKVMYGNGITTSTTQLPL